eukprot:scaffold324408_cov107-Tisochrysis_lutea.AAC.1
MVRAACEEPAPLQRRVFFLQPLAIDSAMPRSTSVLCDVTVDDRFEVRTENEGASTTHCAGSLAGAAARSNDLMPALLPALSVGCDLAVD